MKKTVYLHVGSPKTGTTSIQKFLARNTASLAERGFFVPPQIEDENGAHHALPLSLIKDIYNAWYDGWPNISRKSDVIWNELVEQIDKSEHPNTIISSEIFHEIPNAIYSPHQKKAELFKKRLYNQAGLDSGEWHGRKGRTTANARGTRNRKTLYPHQEKLEAPFPELKKRTT